MPVLEGFKPKLRIAEIGYRGQRLFSMCYCILRCDPGALAPVDDERDDEKGGQSKAERLRLESAPDWPPSQDFRCTGLARLEIEVCVSRWTVRVLGFGRTALDEESCQHHIG